MNSPNNVDFIEGRDPVQRDPNAVRVLFRYSDTATIRIADWVDLHLKVGQPLTQEELQQIGNCSSLVDAERLAKRYLTGRVRTCQQVQNYLSRKDIDSDIAKRVVARLANSNILNDRQYAEWFVEQHAERMGPRQIEAKLRARGVDLEIARDAVGHVVTEQIEDTALVTSAEKFIRRKGTPQTRTDRLKFMNHLVRKGFSPSKVRHVVDSLSENRSE